MDLSGFSLFIGGAAGFLAGWGIFRHYLKQTTPLGENPFAAELASIRKRFDDSQEKLEASTTENAELKSQLSAGMPVGSEELSEELIRARTRIAELERVDTSALQQQLAEAKAALALSPESPNEDATLQQRLSEAEAELDGYRSIEEISKIETMELRKKVASLEAQSLSVLSNPDFDALKAEVVAKDARIAELIALQVAGPAEGAYEAQVVNLRNQLESSREMIRRLEDRLFEASSGSSKNLPAPEAENMRKQIVFLEEELAEARSRLAGREIQPIQTGPDHDSLISDLENANAERARLSNALSLANRELDVLQQAPIPGGVSDEAAARIAEAEAAATAARIQADAAETKAARADTLQAEVESFMASTQALRAENGKLLDELSDLKERDAKKSVLRQEVEDLQNQLQAKELELGQLRGTSGQVESLRDEVARLENSNMSLEDQVSNMRSMLKDAESGAQASTDLESRIAALEGELGAARSEAAEAVQLRAHLEHHRQALSRILAEASGLPAVSSPAAPFASEPTPTPVQQATVVSEPSSVFTPPHDENGVERDALEEINGIGFVYERKLWDGGILTFADLAKSTPEDIERLIMPEPWQHIDPAAWIAEAAERMQ